MKPYGDAYDDYSAGKRDKYPRRSDTPWGLISILVLAGTSMFVTRHRSIQTLNEPVTIPIENEDALAQTPPDEIVYRRDEAAYKLAEATFNPALHELYQDLPPLPPMTEYLETGGWKYTDAVYDYAANHPAAEVVSWQKPRVVLFKSFLSPDEVSHVIAVAKDKLERSHVLSNTEETQVDDVRTSYGAWPPRDPVLNAISERIHRLVAIPKSFGEDLYVLNYKLGQKYDAHNDNCVDLAGGKVPKTLDTACMGFLKRSGGPDCGPGAGGDSCGDRIATFILHLTAPTKGGKTVFPRAQISNERMKASGAGPQNGEDWYCTREEPLGVAPNPGDATLFYDYVPANGAGIGSYQNGTAEPSALPVNEALHSGCPVIENEKWIATRWIRSSRFI